MRGSATIIPIGTVFGRLTVVGPAFSVRKLTRSGMETLRYYPVECVCGTKKDIQSSNLMYGRTLSCGCLYRETRRLISRTHGESGSHLYLALMNMIARCYDSHNDRFDDYGGRGITICDEWRHDFPAFRDWALANGYKPGLTIERKDVNGNYEPRNCTWIPHADQSKNCRSNVIFVYQGETKIMSEWGRDPRCAVCLQTFRIRIQKGWSFERAFTTPNTRCKRHDDL
jgi:hypothetical protein